MDSPEQHQTEQASVAVHNNIVDGFRPLPRAELRRRLKVLMRTDSDFDSFLVDCYPHVYESIGRGMNRDEKINLLFQRESIDDIICALDRWHEIYSSKTATSSDSYLFDCVLNIKYESKNREKIESILVALRSICNGMEIARLVDRPGSTIITLQSNWSTYMALERRSRSPGGLYADSIRIEEIRLIDIDNYFSRISIYMVALTRIILFFVPSLSACLRAVQRKLVTRPQRSIQGLCESWGLHSMGREFFLC